MPLALAPVPQIGRLYLAPEDKAARRDRKKRNGGRDTGKSFTEGWVEFEDKRVAKRVADMLNGQVRKAMEGGRMPKKAGWTLRTSGWPRGWQRC